MGLGRVMRSYLDDSLLKEVALLFVSGASSLRSFGTYLVILLLRIPWSTSNLAYPKTPF